MKSIQDRVASGVALLDQRVPGWVDRINVDRLDMASNVSCVLGQLFSDYGVGCKALGLSVRGAVDHGFQTNLPEPREGASDVERILLFISVAKNNEYGPLNQEWRRVLGILRQKPVTEVTDTTKELVSV